MPVKFYLDSRCNKHGEQSIRASLSRRTPSKTQRRQVFPALSEFVIEQAAENQWSESTVAAFRSFRRHLERFCPDATFDFFDSEGLGRWLVYLRSIGLEESTVRKEFQHLRWFLNWAVRKGYTAPTAVSAFKPKFKIAEKPVVFLTRDELMRLYRFSIPAGLPNASELEDARNCFCFCAFTSLRFSDMLQARWSDIDGDVLYIITQKTFERLPIDICTHARELLDRYPRGTFPDERIFPQMSNRKMNLYLRQLCELCGIDTPITKVFRKGGRRSTSVIPKYLLIGTHAARRTFVCFALSSGIPPQVVMKWTGHSDYRSMKPYIDVASGTRAAAMKRLDCAWRRAK